VLALSDLKYAKEYTTGIMARLLLDEASSIANSIDPWRIRRTKSFD
jgi:hypothetical protein